MKFIKLAGFLVGGMLLFSGCESLTPLQQVVQKRYSVQKGMTKQQVQNVLKVDPDEISQVGNYELWIYKGIIKKDEKETFNDYIVKFVDGKVAYVGYFKCNLPKVEE